MRFFRINSYFQPIISVVKASSLSLFNLNKITYNKGIDKDNLDKDNLDLDCNKSCRDIYIFGDINEELSKKTIKKIKKFNEQDSSLPIRIIINSYGGGVSNAYAIIDEMKNSKSSIETLCQGSCMSSAALLLMCGCKGSRYATENSIILIHPIRRYFSDGDHEVVDNKYYSNPEKKRSEILNTIFLKILENKTELSTEEIKSCCQQDVSFSATEAVNKKIVDQIA